MSSLRRFRKSGGFVQLVSLIETFGTQKREKFLEMIDEESHAWATALREKMLTLDRLTIWPEDAICKVLRGLPVKSQAYALEAFPPGVRDRVNQALTTQERRRVGDVLTENKPKPDEIAWVGAKFLESARRMLIDRELLAEKVDPSLVIPNDIELKLDSGVPAAWNAPVPGAGHAPAHASFTPMASVATAPEPSGDASKLKADLKAAQRENQNLRDEVLKLREKLDLVRRAAS